MPDSAVPRFLVRNGPAGYDHVRRYFDAAGRTPDTVAAVQNALIARLREKAMSAGDGVVRPDGLARWKTENQHSLRALEEADSRFSSRFDSAAGSTQAVLDATRRHAEDLSAFRTSEAGRMLKLRGEDEVVKHVGAAISKGLSHIEGILDVARSNPDAEAGVKAAGFKWLADKFTSPRSRPAPAAGAA